MVEPLEPRQLLSVSHDAGGWTVVTPGSGSRVVYVSSSQGSDSNSGLSQSAPVRSIARAEKLLRSGTGDQLLLKRGDVSRETFGHWKLSGQSSSQPVVIGAYGTGERRGWRRGTTSRSPPGPCRCTTWTSSGSS